MILDAITYGQYARRIGKGARNEAIHRFVAFIERRLGLTAVYPVHSIPFEKPELVEPYQIGQLLEAAGSVGSFRRVPSLPDEPRWRCWESTDSELKDGIATGISADSDRDAFVACIAATLRRQAADSSVPVASAISLVSGKRVPIPDQKTLPGYGIAASPDKAIARLAALLEIIEHAALRQALSYATELPALMVEQLRGERASLAKLLESCERYRLTVHAMHLPTDAPAAVVSVVLEDQSRLAPRFAAACAAHGSTAAALEKALLRALLARSRYRESGATDDKNMVHEAAQLMSLVGKKTAAATTALPRFDTPHEHLRALIDWCRARGYECTALSYGTSASNPTPWHIERIILPALQTEMTGTYSAANT